ncbi:MAG TPA: efflux RND transporter periplasmic adaptor subunit, partial [Thermoanaerobaculia bacterium]|nr:efflux RND transporter periplasmic adaptor subunit [Thermoanaerobaculia bacterium]
MNSNRTVIAFALAALAGACSPAAQHAEAPSVAVNAIEIVRPAAVEQTLSALGTVRAGTTATLTSKVVGNVTEVRVHEGDHVRRGEIVAIIDARDIAAQLSQAMAASHEVDGAAGAARAARDAAAANARLATVTYERYKTLRERNSVSAQEFDEVEARYLAANAERERASKALDQSEAGRQLAAANIAGASAALSWSRIASPIDGVVTARWIDPGAQAAPGVPLLAIESVNDGRVEASVDEDHIPSIRQGQAVAIDTRAGAGVATGHVAHIAPSPDSATRSYLVKIALPPDTPLKSGMSVTVRFPIGQRDGISIPRTALIERGELHEVWVADVSDVARLRYVTPGVVFGDRIEILTGIAPGDRVITNAGQPLADGARITLRGRS